MWSSGSHVLGSTIGVLNTGVLSVSIVPSGVSSTITVPLSVPTGVTVVSSGILKRIEGCQHWSD